KEAKIQINRKVWKNFSKTIGRRPDGYSVRLRWREMIIPLPIKRATALRKLGSV
ncbi:hypothetical protein Angca_001279, partial [Angiostrongylus cantonensis]